MKDTIELFVQGVGMARIALLNIPIKGKVQDIIELARDKGLSLDNEQSPQIWLENAEEPLELEMLVDAAGIQARSRIHIHTCRRVHVTVNFQNQLKQHPFSPSATISTVKQWADQKFGLNEVDATEYALQICGTADRPADDIQVGIYAQPEECKVCFDLVPKQRVEG